MKRSDYLVKTDFVYRDDSNICAVQASNARLTLDDGREVVDLESANGTALFGYDADLISSLRDELSVLPLVPSFVETDLRLDLAKRFSNLIERETGRFGRVSFDLGGAQGIEVALKYASKCNPNKKTIIVMDGCYHGRSLATSTLSCSPRYESSFYSSPFNIVRLPVPDFLNGSHEENAIFCKNYIESIFTDERFGLCGVDPADILALVYEPIINVSGLVPLRSEYLRGIVGFVRNAGGIVIADEIFSGLYRSGNIFASFERGVIPDIAVFSKIITNGITPLSVVWVNECIDGYDQLKPGLHSVTFGNSQLAFHVAMRVIARLESITREDISVAEATLAEICKVVTAARWEFESFEILGLTAKIKLSDGVSARRVRNGALSGIDKNGKRIGVLCASTGLTDEYLMLYPPLTISSREVNDAIDVLSNFVYAE